MNHITPIIHTTDKCNMACRYCYAGSAWGTFDIKKINKSFSSKIPVLLKFIDQVVSYNGYIPTTFFFHGGEPLLINLKNWKHILSYFREKNYPAEIHIQTNGILINENFIDLFKEFNVKIGVSLDGPASLNDQTRVFKDGKGSFSAIYQNLQKMKNAGLKFGCLVTLNKTNIEHVGEIYTFFKENNIPFNVRTIFESRYSVPKELLISPRAYATAVCKLFDLWFYDDQTKAFLINDFANIVARFIEPIEGLATCTFIKNCSKYFISFDLDGNLWHCARLRGETDFLYGNILKDDLAVIIDNPKREQLLSRWEKLSKTSCKDCEVSQYCFGGCPGRAYRYYGDYFEKDYFCEAFKIILKHAYEKIKSSLKLKNEKD